MAPSAIAQVLLSPAELSYLHASLSNTPPLRPDGRSTTQFRPLIAEQDILPSTNGSARVCFADGTEAIVGIKAEVEKTNVAFEKSDADEVDEGQMDIDNEQAANQAKPRGENAWVDMTIDIPGYRDDDSLPIFLSSMLTEALLASGELQSRLWINRRFHWKLYIDVLLLSEPLSYPLPLLSITTYLALTAARLPALVSEGDEDPLFNDDWEASTYLYPKNDAKRPERPSITLLVVIVAENIIFDPAKEELAVADAVFAASLINSKDGFKVVSIRTVDPPSRLTTPGVLNSLNNALGTLRDDVLAREAVSEEGVWNPPRGGLQRNKISKIMSLLLDPKGVVKDILDGLDEVIS